MNETGEYVQKPGTRTMEAGLVIAVIAFVLIVFSVMSGGGPTIYTLGALVAGMLVTVVGFGRRVLAALETR
jgi:hypothetical protein